MIKVLLKTSLQNLSSKKSDWIPGKGYHFPEGPYVEYSGKFDETNKENLKYNIQSLCNEFIKQANDTKLIFMDKDKMKELCHYVPDYLPTGKPLRVVMYGDYGVPCGGTHVTNLSDVKEITIRDIKHKKENIRVCYDIRNNIS